MINKNKVNIKDTKKILHKVGKKWVVVSAVLLGLVAGGSVVSHMNVNADANQATTQTVQSQNSDQSKTSSAQSSVAPASSSKASTSGPTHEKLKSTASANSGESSVASSTNQDVNSSLGNVPTSQDSQASNNSSNGVNYVDQLLSFNVDDLFNIVNNNKNNRAYPRLMNDLKLFLDENLSDGDSTPYTMYNTLNSTNNDMQNINGNKFSDLNKQFSDAESQLEKSIQNNRHISQSLSDILYNTKGNIHAGTNYKDNDSIAYYMTKITKDKLNIAGTTVNNYLKISSSEASDIITIANDMAKIDATSPAIDDYQNIFFNLSNLINQNKVQEANTLNNISYNINDMLNYAKLPNDKFTDALKTFASEATSKAVSLTHSTSDASGSASNVPSSQNSQQSNGFTSSSGMIPKSPSMSSKSNLSSSGDNSTSKQNTNGSSHASTSQDSASTMGQSTQSNQNTSDMSQDDTDQQSNVNPINSLPDFNIPVASSNSSSSITPMSSSVSNVNIDSDSVSSTQISSSATPSATSTANDSSATSSKISHSAKAVASTYLKNNDFKRAKKNRTVVSTKGFYEYKRNRHGKMKRISFVKPGTKLTVKRVVQNGKLTKLELTNGHVVTANKHLVKLANVKLFKRISTYARALRRANYRVRHNHRLTKFRANRIKKRLVTANQSKIKAQRRFNRRHTLRNHRALNRAVSKLARIENALLK